MRNESRRDPGPRRHHEAMRRVKTKERRDCCSLRFLRVCTLVLSVSVCALVAAACWLRYALQVALPELRVNGAGCATTRVDDALVVLSAHHKTGTVLSRKLAAALCARLDARDSPRRTLAYVVRNVSLSLSLSLSLSERIRETFPRAGVLRAAGRERGSPQDVTRWRRVRGRTPGVRAEAAGLRQRERRALLPRRMVLHSRSVLPGLVENELEILPIV